jgi:anti-sigma factor RsiW
MNCNDLKQHLMPFADGELEPALAAEVEKSLADCPECREELAEIRRIGGLSRAAFLAPVEAVSLAGVYDGVMARIQAEDVAALPAQPSLWARFTRWCSEVVRFERPMVLAGAAALAVALVVGLTLAGGDERANGVGPSPTVANSELKRRGAEEEVKMGKNTAFVEHLEANKGKAYVEFDKNDPEAPMVLWHVVEEDGAPVPKGL